MSCKCGKPVLKIERVDKDLPLPKYAIDDDSGMDLMSTINYTIVPGEVKLIPTGVKIEIQRGFEGQVRPRSGLALKNGITVLNTPGTIDSKYRGIVGVILCNHGNNFFEIKRGDRICQLVIAPVANCEIVEVESVNDTDRGDGGFGHTGV